MSDVEANARILEVKDGDKVIGHVDMKTGKFSPVGVITKVETKPVETPKTEEKIIASPYKFKCYTCDTEKHLPQEKSHFGNFNDAVAHVSKSENAGHRIQDLSVQVRQAPRITSTITPDLPSGPTDSDGGNFRREVGTEGAMPAGFYGIPIKKISHPREDEMP